MLNYNNFINEAVKKKVSKEATLIAAAKRGGNVKDIIKSGVNINAIDIDGKTALMHAVEGKYIVIAKQLLEAGADTNIISTAFNYTALMLATTLKMIDLLLKFGANIDYKDKDGNTIISKCLKFNSNRWMIIPLIERGLDVDIKNNKGENFYEILKTTLKEKFDLNDQLSDGLSQLFEIEKYMDEKFPQYKDENETPYWYLWEIQQDMKKYNVW